MQSKHWSFLEIADHLGVIHYAVHKQLTHDKSKLHPLHNSYEGHDFVKEGYLELEFKDKTAAINAFKVINNKIWAGGNPPYEDINQEGNTIQIDTDDNLNSRNQMLKDLDKGGLKGKYKVAVNELDEGTSNLVDTIKNLWIEAAAAAVDPKEREELDGGK